MENDSANELIKSKLYSTTHETHTKENNVREIVKRTIHEIAKINEHDITIKIKIGVI